MKATDDDVLSAIKTLLRSKGYSPTLAEIGFEVGLRSNAPVHRHLKALERAGKIRRKPGSPRAIEVLK